MWQDDVTLAKKVLKYWPSCDFLDDKGYNLLMQTTNFKMAEALIGAGCDVDYQAPDGETAFSLAIKNNNTPFGDLLRKNNAKFPWKKISPSKDKK